MAWAISNREDAIVLTAFLKAVKSRLKEHINPKYFMTDDAQQYFTAWTAAFESQHMQKFLCRWHIDRAWRKKISQHIDSQQEKIETYHLLQVLLLERDKAKFANLLQQFLSHMAHGSQSTLDRHMLAVLSSGQHAIGLALLSTQTCM